MTPNTQHSTVATSCASRSLAAAVATVVVFLAVLHPAKSRNLEHITICTYRHGCASIKSRSIQNGTPFLTNSTRRGLVTLNASAGLDVVAGTWVSLPPTEGFRSVSPIFGHPLPILILLLPHFRFPSQLFSLPRSRPATSTIRLLSTYVRVPHTPNPIPKRSRSPNPNPTSNQSPKPKSEMLGAGLTIWSWQPWPAHFVSCGCPRSPS